MLESIRRFFAPPVFDDEDTTRRARVLNTLLLTLILTVPLIIVGGLVGGDATPVTFIIPAIVWVVLLIFRSVMRSGQVTLAATGLVFVTIVATTGAIFDSGTIRTASTAFFILNIVTAGLVIGRRAAVGAAVSSALIVLALFFVEIQGWMPPVGSTTLASWFTFAIACAITTVMLNLATGSIDAALARARQKESELRALATSLEQRVVDRTRDISLAAEVGRNLSGVQELEAMLTEAVELIRSRFNLYYTQIYLTDSAGTALVMIAGTGMVGLELKRRAFRLSIGSGSINGTAAATRQLVIVGDASNSPVFRPNPMLPGTRSELAVPLIAGDRVVGVLDLQSDRSYTFTDENKVAFTALAGQLAISIQNNLLFSEARESRATVEEQARRLVRTGWQDFLDAIHQNERIEQTYEATSLGLAATGDSLQTVSAPIEVVGESIGTLSVEGTAAWGESESELVNAVAQQVARQIESIRLLAQAEQYRDRAEQATRRLTREGWQEYLGVAAAGAYVYDGDQVVALPADPEHDSDTIGDSANVVQSITVHGETIGEVIVEGINANDEGVPDIVESVVAQLSSHIENLRLSAQTQDALSETRLLYDTSARLNAANTLEETLKIAVEPAINSGANDALLFIFDLDDQNKPEWMEVRANWAREDAIALPTGVRFFMESYPLAPLLGNLESPVLIDDPAHDPRITDRLRAGLNQSGVQALAAMPLVAGTQPLGLMIVNWTTGHKFGPSDEQVYKSLATQAAIVVDNRLLFAQTQAALAESRQMYEASRRLAAAVTLQDVMSTLVESAAISVIDRAALMMLDRDSSGGLRGVQVAASWHSRQGPKAETAGRYYSEEEVHGVGIFQIAEPTFLDDAQTDPRVGAGTRAMFARQNVRGVAALPLWIGGRQLGVFLLQSEVPHHFTESEIRPLTSLTQQMAIAVENRQLFEQTQNALNETEELYKASARLNAANTPQETLLSVTQSIARSPVSGAFLFTFDFDAQRQPESMRTIVAIDSELRPLTEFVGSHFPVSAFSYSKLWLKDAEPLIIGNVATDPRVSDSDRALMPDVGSIVLVPLRLGPRWIGLISASWLTPQHFAEAQTRIIQSLAAQAATVLDNQLLLRTTQKRAERESIINQIAQKIQSSTSIEGAVQTAVRELGQAFKARRTVVEIGSPVGTNGHSDDNGHSNGQSE